MAEPPSDALLRSLYGLRLCTAGDLRRCRGRVRRLASDLPAFDSVWIDALQRTGRLTPFQARVLDAGEAESLGVGPCVLVDRLGPARTGRTFVARHRDTGEECVLKRIDPRAGTEVEIRLRALVERAAAISHSSIVAPRTCRDEGLGLVLVSTRVDGPSLEELLVRRGRFPPRVVLAIARQLAEGLADLERLRLVHGDLRTTNTRLLAAGRIVAVDAGVRPALEPEVRIREIDGPERFDGIAPERIGNGRTADTRSEVYAFGCLVWTLLAGRPPFPTGDVLGKLAAHARQDVPAVDEIAPDTPPGLVRLLAEATARDPARRPRSFADVSATLGRSNLGDRSVLSTFHRSFERSVPALPRWGPTDGPGRRRAVAALAIVVAGFVTLAARDDWRNALTAQAARMYATATSFVRSPTAEPDQSIAEKRVTPADALRALPEPDADGLVLLDAAGPYRASELSTIGPLVLRGTAGTRPVIVVDGEPLKLWAEELRIENVEIRAATTDFGALALVRCQRLEIEGATFVEPAPSRTDASNASNFSKATSARYGLAWRPLDRRDADGGSLVLRDVAFLGGQSGVFASVPPREFVAENVLKAGRGSLVEFATNPAPGADTTLRLANVTLREATHLVRSVRQRAEAGVTWIEATDCVFDLAGPSAALLAWLDSPNSVPDRVQFESTDSVLAPDVPAATLTTADGRTIDASTHPNVIVEGLTANRIVFAGPPNDPRGSVALRLEGPRLGSGTRRPGIRIDRLVNGPDTPTRQ